MNNTQKKTDLLYIIDDDEIIVYLTGKTLRKHDFTKEIKTFCHGLEALENLKNIAQSSEQQWPDIILLDLNMPIMDGWQFIESFIELGLSKNISLFIYSSSIDRSDQERSQYYSDHIKGFITKPLTIDKLKGYLVV
jgi:CheY-like chemotaxis protein